MYNQHCQGEQCMAWRWYYQDETYQGTQTIAGRTSVVPGLKRMARTNSGFCGMVAKSPDFERT